MIKAERKKNRLLVLVMSDLLFEICSDKNIETACDFLLKKKDSCGTDGMYLSELPEYLAHNKSIFVKSIVDGDYTFSLAEWKIILGRTGKKREITILCSVDRLLLRMIYQVMYPLLSDKFACNSYAYIEGRGVYEAVNQCKTYIEMGLQYVVELDIKDFFDNISHSILCDLLKEEIDDLALIRLIEKYLKMDVRFEDKIRRNNKGVIQGSSLGPLFSNLFLSELDWQMQYEKVAYVRFSDDIKVFCSDYNTAAAMFSTISNLLRGCGLKLSEKKCGIFKANTRTYFGYEFINTHNGIVVQRKTRNAVTQLGNWQAAKLEWRDNEYHIISDGILTKKDFSILFENQEKKMYIPVEATSVISVYSDVILSSDFVRFAAEHRLMLRFFDKHGEYVGSFCPSYQKMSVKTTIAQSVLYDDTQKRLHLAKKIIIASTHNIKSNIQYYSRRYKENDLSSVVKALSEFTKMMNEADSIEHLMLIEARMREAYFSCFDTIIRANGFNFEKRSRRPPKNEVNAMISFGNTILYSYIANAIIKTDLDIRIAFLHSANRRPQSLNLDIAELFKPIIVDRLIFSLINKHIIVTHKHFTQYEDGAVLLNREGKNVFLSAFKEKLSQTIDVKGEKVSYAQLISREVWKLRSYIIQGDKYTPYKCEW